MNVAQSARSPAQQTIRTAVHRWVLELAMLLCYVVLSIIITWPLTVHMQTTVIGRNTIDAIMNSWNMWWVAHALSNFQSPFWTTMLYYPDGVQMYVQTMNASNGLLTMPITMLAGPIAAYNVALLLALTLTGYGSSLLVRHVVAERWIAWFCGVLVAAGPFCLMRVDAGQSNLIAMQWIPFYMLALMRVETRPSRSAVSLAVLMLVTIMLTEWYYAFVCAAYSLIWMSLSLVAAQGRRTILAHHYALIGGGTLLALLSFFVGMGSVYNRLPSPDVGRDVIWRAYIRGFSADALGLFFPAVFNPIWGSAVRSWLEAHAYGTFATEGWYIGTGSVLLLCAILGIRHAWSLHSRLLITAGLMWLFSLGPSARIAGFDTKLPLLYGLLEQIPLLSAARRPALFALGCLFILAMFAGIGLHWIATHLPIRWARVVVVGLVCLSVIELWPPTWQVTTMTTPAVYQYLRNAPAGDVADLPLEWAESSRALQAQMVHQHPMLGGYVARWPEYPAMQYSPFLNQIAAMEYWGDTDITKYGQQDLLAMQCAFPLRYVVIDKTLMSAPQRSNIQALLHVLLGRLLETSYEDQTHQLYTLPDAADQCRPYVALGDGWFPLEQQGDRSWRWMEGTGQLWIVNPNTAPISVVLNLFLAGSIQNDPVHVQLQQHQLATW